jgi:hypothetical protein
MAEAQPAEAQDIVYCTVHPTIETTLRCNKCGRPMCSKCAVRTPVGYRCKECVRGQQAVFYTANSLDPLIQFIVSVPLSAVAAALAGAVGGFFLWFIAIPASSFVGFFIADLAHRVVGKRRSRYSWLSVAAGIVVGALVVALIPALLYGLMLASLPSPPQGATIEEGYTPPSFSPWLLVGSGFTSIGWWIYVVVGTASAIGRLRMSSKGWMGRLGRFF